MKGYLMPSMNIPAGMPKPVPIPPGKKIISISNPNGDLGDVTFNLSGTNHILPYFPNVVDLGYVFDFPSPGLPSYDFLNNAVNPAPTSIDLVWEDFI